MLIGIACCVGPIDRAGLIEDVVNMVAHGTDAGEEFLVDLPVSLAGSDQQNHYSHIAADRGGE